MITRYIKGDIRDTELQHIAHGVNCQNVMGSGIAKALYERWPKVKEYYHGYSIKVLGAIQPIQVENHIVWNCYTQNHYLPRTVRNVNYAAIVNCFSNLRDMSITKLAIPKIGCGLAGGDWNIVEQLINDTVGDRMEIWVYEIDDKKS